jgi:AAA domain
MTQRLRKFEIQGFRGFGTSPQSITLPDSVAAIWGGNSQGKTSLAEALEFLLTGQIARRDLVVSAKDEFSRSLRNVHMPTSVPVFVGGEFLCPDGQTRKLRRWLISDYDGNAACTSRLDLDGTPCAETDIEGHLGIQLQHPPLRAPVLAQHTLGYVFTASPTDRAAYFRAVLDTQDLEDFRSVVASLPLQLETPDMRLLGALGTLTQIEGLANIEGSIQSSATQVGLEQVLGAAIATLLKSIGMAPAASLTERIPQLEEALEKRRRLAFPLDLFARKSFPTVDLSDGQLIEQIDLFQKERDAIEEETRRLVALFECALAVPAIHDCKNPINCPLCESPTSLTPERVAHIRGQVEVNQSYQTAERALSGGLASIDSRIQVLKRAAAEAVPKFMRLTGADRRQQGFQVERVSSLSDDPAGTKQWVLAAGMLGKETKNLRRACDTTCQGIKAALTNLGDWKNGVQLVDQLTGLRSLHARVEAAHDNYAAALQPLLQTMKPAVDQSSKTEGWEELLRFARDPAPLFEVLQRVQLHRKQLAAIEQALKEIDAAAGKVADEKFVDLSDEVTRWWEMLRPGEASYFSSVRRRSVKARRTIDLKVALSENDDRGNPKLRDAVAVFSQSQLHCLGLSLFLARAIDNGAKFILLDDPVLTSDDDFRPHFASSVIEGLLDIGIQVIVLTQDHSTWKDIGHRWRHRGATLFQLVRDNPVAGTEVRSQNDDLAAMLVQAQPFIPSHDNDQRKEGATRLRRAIERFCKELIVKARHANGDNAAMITDYDGKNYGEFGAKALALLTLDPAHKGKLTAAYNYVTTGPHDDTPPSSSQLKMAAGDLKQLKRDYLG